jgi:hypothetical protein
MSVGRIFAARRYPMLQNDLPEVINDQLSAQLAVYSKAHALIASAKVLLRDKKIILAKLQS